jgi:hypothetical protein
LAHSIRNEKVKEACKPIAGKFEVIRTEIGSTTKPFRDIVAEQLETNLKEMGVDYTFPLMSEVTNNKLVLEQMMTAFHKEYPDKGLLLVVDELLDYLHSRDDLEIVLDLTFLRELGEITRELKFRFMAGVQEALFDNPRFSAVASSLKRVIERHREVPIERSDIKYVVSHRLLRKNPEQAAKIREHLSKFARFYGDMNRRMDEFVGLFPIHPDYVDTFERLTAIEKRQVLKTFSLIMRDLLEHDVPEDSPGVISYDQYWSVVKQNPSIRAEQAIRETYECSSKLEGLIETGYPKGKNLDFARRIIHGLSIHRLAVGDIERPVGLTAENLRDQLCLWDPMIVDLGGDPADDLRGETETALRLISRTVNGQFISATETDKEGRLGGQFYLDIRKTVDYDANIRTRAESIADHELDLAYFDALAQVLERSDQYYPGTRLAWEYDLEWVDHSVFRRGYIFFGAPNERNTAQPPRDFYLFFLRPYGESMFKDEKDPRDVFFRLSKRDEVFDLQLRYYAAARALAGRAGGTEKAVYSTKTGIYRREIAQWLCENMHTAYNVAYQGRTRSLQEFFTGRLVQMSDSRNFRDTVNTTAEKCLAPHFENLAPEYPKFKTRISRANQKDAVTDALQNIGAFARGGVHGGKLTRRGMDVLDSLELLAGDDLRPETSRYAAHILQLLAPRARGEALNRGQILTMVETGVEYLVPSKHRLEPEWVAVVLASLVYSGHLVMSVRNKKYDASGVDHLVQLSVDDLTGFGHVEKPKDWPVPEMSRLFELVGMSPGLATQVTMGSTEPVKVFQDRVATMVDSVIQVRERITRGFYLFNENLLTDDETTQVKKSVDSLKSFLESLRVFSTAAKFKNLAYTLEDIEAQKENVSALSDMERLDGSVSKLAQIAGYLSQALGLLPEGHRWIEGAGEAKREALKVLRDPEKRGKSAEIQGLVSGLEALKAEYIDVYLDLHSKARLGLTDDKTKAQITQDGRLKNLEALAAILTNTAYVAGVREHLGSLKPCFSLSKETLKVSPVCPECSFKPAVEQLEGTAGLILDHIDRDLDKTLENWTKQLIEMLEDPTAQSSIELMAGESKKIIEDFLAKRRLPARVDDKFVKACDMALTGLVRVRVDIDSLRTSLVQDGGPATMSQLKERLEKHLSDLVKGNDPDKVRIVFE